MATILLAPGSKTPKIGDPGILFCGRFFVPLTPPTVVPDVTPGDINNPAAIEFPNAQGDSYYVFETPSEVSDYSGSTTEPEWNYHHELAYKLLAADNTELYRQWEDTENRTIISDGFELINGRKTFDFTMRGQRFRFDASGMGEFSAIKKIVWGHLAYNEWQNVLAGFATLRTENVSDSGWNHTRPKWFKRPEGVGKYHLKIGDKMTPWLQTKVYTNSAWVDFPADGIGPEFAGHPICVIEAISASAMACWVCDGAFGDPFWFLI